MAYEDEEDEVWSGSMSLFGRAMEMASVELSVQELADSPCRLREGSSSPMSGVRVPHTM